MEDWSGGDWVVFGIAIIVVGFLMVRVWQSPRSMLGVGLRLLWRRMRGRG